MIRTAMTMLLSLKSVKAQKWIARYTVDMTGHPQAIFFKLYDAVALHFRFWRVKIMDILRFITVIRNIHDASTVQFVSNKKLSQRKVFIFGIEQGDHSLH